MAADSGNSAGFHHPQQLSLNFQGHFADLIEKNGTAFGQFKFPRLAFAEGSGKCPFDVAEEFAFDQIPGQAGAIDDNKGALGKGTGPVNGVGKHFFTGTAFAFDQDAFFKAGHFFSRFDNHPHLWVLGDDVGKGIGGHVTTDPVDGAVEMFDFADADGVTLNFIIFQNLRDIGAALNFATADMGGDIGIVTGGFVAIPDFTGNVHFFKDFFKANVIEFVHIKMEDLLGADIHPLERQVFIGDQNPILGAVQRG